MKKMNNIYVVYLHARVSYPKVEKESGEEEARRAEQGVCVSVRRAAGKRGKERYGEV